MYRIVAVLILVAFATYSCNKNNAPIVFKSEISYRVTGTAQDYEIEYIDELGYYQKAAAKKNWEYTFKSKPGKYVYLSAKNNTGAGSVKVDIRKKGERVFSYENLLPYGVATVSGYIK